MRPRVFPAEDNRERSRTTSKPYGASMRPRVFPAEDRIVYRRPARSCAASMRPRVFPAEDAVDAPVDALLAAGFNEAAGIPRGRIPYLFRGVPYLSVPSPYTLTH